MKVISAKRLWLARGLAVAADALEVGILPIFGEGFASPAADVLDVVMCGVMTGLTGWHLAYLPTVVMKVVPVIDLAPCWTLAVLIATRKSQVLPLPPPLPPPLPSSLPEKRD